MGVDRLDTAGSRRTLLDGIESAAGRSSRDDADSSDAIGKTEIVELLRIALDPTVLGVFCDPDSPSSFVLRRGSLDRTDLSAIAGLWPRARAMLDQLEPSDWRPLFALVLGWQSLMPEYGDAGTILTGMLADMAGLSRTLPGVQHRLRRIAGKLGADIEVTLDPDFEAVCPPPRDGTLEDRRAHDRRLDGLCRTWARGRAEDIVDKLRHWDRHAEWAGIPSFSWPVFRKLASYVPKPAAWARVLLDRRIDAPLLEPFLDRVAHTFRVEDEDLLRTCLHDPEYQAAAIRRIVRLEDPPQALLDETLAVAELHVGSVQRELAAGAIPVATSNALLRHPAALVVKAAVLGEWSSHPYGEVRDEVRESWRTALLRHGRDEPGLAELLAQELASDSES